MSCEELDDTVEAWASRMLEDGEAAVRAAYDRLHASTAGQKGIGVGAIEGDIVENVVEVTARPEAETAKIAEQEVKKAMEGSAKDLVDSLVSWAMASGKAPREMTSRCAGHPHHPLPPKL